MPLSDVIGRIPFLGGYEAQREINQQRGMGEMQQASGLMNILGQAQGLQDKQRALQEEAFLKQTVAQAKTPEEAIQKLVNLGTPTSIKLAGVLAEATKDMRKQNEDFTLSPGQVRYRGGQQIAQAPHAPEKPESSPEIVRLLKIAEQLPPGPMRAAIERQIEVKNKDPSTRIYNNNPAPVTALVMQDTTSPTGWSYVDGRTQKLISKGAPPPAGAARNAAADPTVPPPAPEGVTAVPAGVQGAAGTGGSGFFGGIANTVADAVGRPMPYPNVETASQALKNLQVQTMTVAQDSVPGRPSNYLMQQLKQLSVTPNSLLMADQRSKTRLEQTRAMLQTEVARMQREVLERPNQYTAAQLSKTRNSFGQLRQLVGEYDRVISSFGGTAAASDVMNQADEILKRSKKP